MSRASRLFAKDGGEFHEVCVPRRSDNHQPSAAGSRGEAGKVGVRFRGFKVIRQEGCDAGNNDRPFAAGA